MGRQQVIVSSCVTVAMIALLLNIQPITAGKNISIERTLYYRVSCPCQMKENSNVDSLTIQMLIVENTQSMDS